MAARKEVATEALRHLNGILQSVTFIVETEKNRVLPFMDFLVTRKVDDTTGYAV